MSIRTQEYIEETFGQMLNEQSLSRITVREIANRCGISRNCFYYHFDDIPTLLTKTVGDEVDKAIAAIPENASTEEALHQLVTFARSRETAIMHIHFSDNRQVVEDCLLRTCRYLAEKYAKSSPLISALSSEDARLIQSALSYELFGLCMDWLNHHMKYDIEKDFHRLRLLLEKNFHLEQNPAVSKSPQV